MSFPALALAAAAVAEVHRSTGIRPAFIKSCDIEQADSGFRWIVMADLYAFPAQLDVIDGQPLGFHDPANTITFPVTRTYQECPSQ